MSEPRLGYGRIGHSLPVPEPWKKVAVQPGKNHYQDTELWKARRQEVYDVSIVFILCQETSL